VREAGFDIWVDTEIESKHIGTELIDMEYFINSRVAAREWIIITMIDNFIQWVKQ